MATILNLDRLVLAINPNDSLFMDQTSTNDLTAIGVSQIGSPDFAAEFSGEYASRLYSEDQDYYRLKPTSEMSLMLILSIEFVNEDTEEWLLGKGADASGPDLEYALFKNSSNQLVFRTYDESGTAYDATSSALEASTRYFIVCGYENSLDGSGKSFIEINRGTRDVSVSANTDPAQVGAGSNFEVGAVVEDSMSAQYDMYALWMFRRIVTTDELDYLYNSGSVRLWDDVISDLALTLDPAISISASSSLSFSRTRKGNDATNPDSFYEVTVDNDNSYSSVRWQIRRQTNGEVRFDFTTTPGYSEPFSTITNVDAKTFRIKLPNNYVHEIRYRVSGGSWTDWVEFDTSGELPIVGNSYKEKYQTRFTERGAVIQHQNPRFREVRTSRGIMIVKNDPSIRPTRDYGP